MRKFLVFGDRHLVDVGETSLGLDTHRRFGGGVDWVNAHHADADFCVLAGGRADQGLNGARDPYQRSYDEVAWFAIFCHIVLQHHANPPHKMVDWIRRAEPWVFLDVLKGYGDIRQVIAGQVHDTSTALWHGILFTTLGGGHWP